MISHKNLKKIKEITLKLNKVLDLGGGRHVLPYATHVVDLEPLDSYLVLDPIDPNFKPRFNKKTWLVKDVCNGSLPYKDKYFDFCFCSHLLEDIKDPISVCNEIMRISKSGYIEVPSRQREIFAKSRFFKIKSFFGKMPEIGYYHHRWFVELGSNELIFTPKDGRIYQDKKRYITRSELGRKMTDDESAIFLFWHKSFSVTEKFIGNSEELAEFKTATLKKLTG
tara:strand:- start:1046 stop:1717 length:672 start_codon:yes stop_codon:yes gene_type:complete